MNLSRKFSSSEKLLLGFLALVLLFCAYFFFVQRPIGDAMTNAQSEIETLNVDLQLLTAKQVRFATMKTELEAIKAAGGTAAVPDYDNLQQLMGFLNMVFGGNTQYSLTIEGIEHPEGSAGVVRRSMKMTFVSASYDEARVVIDRLQRAPFCCAIGDVSIGCNDENRLSITEGLVDTTLTITFFEKLSA